MFVLLLHFTLLQVTVAQSADTGNNGRANDATPTTTTTADEAATTNAAQDEFRKRGHDFDDPNAEINEDQADMTFPAEVEELRDEMSAAGYVNNKDIQNRLIALESELNELRTYNEMLRLENRSIRRSLGNCCSEVKDGMTAADAYLLQSAPNPFNASAEIQYFIPADLENATIEVRDLKGVLIQNFNLTESGIGKVTVNGQNVSDGTYLYSLVIEGEIIDSKVMILTK